MRVTGRSAGRPAASRRLEIDCLLAGHAEAVDEFRGLAVRYLASIDTHGLRDSWDDVCQEALIALLVHPPQLRERDAQLSYLRKTVRSAYIDQLRREFGRRRRDPQQAGPGEQNRGWRRHVPLEESLDRPELKSGIAPGLADGLNEALVMLEPRRRTVLVSKYVWGQSDTEGAGSTHESLSTYRRLVTQGLADLRRLMGPRQGRVST